MSSFDDPLDPPADPPGDDDGGYQPTIIRLCNSMLTEALRRAASVVHIQPEPDQRLVIRFRVEGVLFAAMEVPALMRNGFLARLKIVANLDIAERRLPQDGRILIRLENQEVEFAISTVPTVNGESAVLHRLDGPMVRRESVAAMGYEPEILAAFQTALTRPGVIVLAGPTHSGRHTALYAALSERNRPDVSIATVEAPVRWAVAGLRQVNVYDEIGLGFAAAVRVFLRQDVEVIGIGGIWDYETAELAFSAAHRGTQLITTIHTISAAATIGRFVNMGVAPWVVADGLSLVIGQRLVRRLCARCRIADKVDPAALVALGIAPAKAETATIFRRAGCDDCHATGFTGRVLIAEALVVDDAVRAAIRAEKPLPAGAVRGGLRAAALARACEGVTTVDEALLVTPAP